MDDTRTDSQQELIITYSLEWSGNGAIHIVLKSLNEVEITLERLIKESRVLNLKLQPHGLQYPRDARKVKERFEWDVFRLHDELTVELGHCVITAILMAAIELENEVNYLLYRDISEVVGEALESLSLEKKLEAAHRILGQPQFKGTAQQEAVTQLVRWRNKFAHGKQPDTSFDPSRWRDDATTGEEQCGSQEWEVQQLARYMCYYVTAAKHVGSISPTLSGMTSLELLRIDHFMRFIALYEYRDGYVVRRRQIPPDLRQHINSEWQSRLAALDTMEL